MAEFESLLILASVLQMICGSIQSIGIDGKTVKVIFEDDSNIGSTTVDCPHFDTENGLECEDCPLCCPECGNCTFEE